MNAARSAKRRNWPRGLYEPRPGYYFWRHPDGRNIVMGAMPLAHAIHQAMQANAFIAAERPSILDKLTGANNTIAQLLAKMEPATKPNTVKTHRSLDKAITAAIGAKTCAGLTITDCAEFIEGVRESGRARWAQSLRSRLVAVCRRGMNLGWMDDNPAEITDNPTVVVKRGRMTLEYFNAVHAQAGEVAEWLPLAMMLALVTGQDRSTIAAMKRADVVMLDGERTLIVQRSKTADTNAPVAIPCRLRLEVAGASVDDLLARRSRVVSPLVIHHQRPWGNAPVGSAVHTDKISHAFTEARKAAGFPDTMPDGKGAPTFHEIRSLSKRLYERQGNVDTKALLGHSTDRAADLYANPRGAEPTRVRVK